MQKQTSSAQKKHLAALGRSQRLDLLGQQFERLTVVKALPPNIHHKSMWRCRCDCGNIIDVQGGHLKSGHTTSCGCFKAEAFGNRNRKHGQSGDQNIPEYVAWKNMKARCYGKNFTRFENWGGRGITVCRRWKNNFEAFLADVGPRPSPKHSLDRYPDNNGNYRPGNVRWATGKQQANNTRKNTDRQARRILILKLREQNLTMQEISKKLGCSIATVWREL